MCGSSPHSETQYFRKATNILCTTIRYIATCSTHLAAFDRLAHPPHFECILQRRGLAGRVFPPFKRNLQTFEPAYSNGSELTCLCLHSPAKRGLRRQPHNDITISTFIGVGQGLFCPWWGYKGHRGMAASSCGSDKSVQYRLDQNLEME